MKPLVDEIRSAAHDEGFADVGVTPAVDSQGFSSLVQWIEHGYAGQMRYFAERLDAYRHPRGVLPGSKSIIALSYPYPRPPRRDCPVGHGRAARYTMIDDDYHDIIHPKLKRLCRHITQSCPDARARGIVDTAPLMEREVAELAGLGWRGKNTLLLNRLAGSYFFLACILVDVVLPYDTRESTAHCGVCTACLDACPTDAFVQPHVLDATRCISYWTIESRELPPVAIRSNFGDWWFGCDVCQEVCPWNRKPTRGYLESDPSVSPESSAELLSLFELDENEFRSRFRKTPMWRSKRGGLLRNAAIVLGNQRDISAIPSLLMGLNDSEAVVRAASAWALQRMPTPQSRAALGRRFAIETDPMVLTELARGEPS